MSHLCRLSVRPYICLISVDCRYVCTCLISVDYRYVCTCLIFVDYRYVRTHLISDTVGTYEDVSSLYTIGTSVHMSHLCRLSALPYICLISVDYRHFRTCLISVDYRHFRTCLIAVDYRHFRTYVSSLYTIGTSVHMSHLCRLSALPYICLICVDYRHFRTYVSFLILSVCFLPCTALFF